MLSTFTAMFHYVT